MKMKAAFVTDVGKVSIEEIERPSIRDDEVLIRVRTVGVCGSDLHLFRGTHAFRKPPAILGHEIAGDVVEIGKDVRDIRLGDRVTVEPQYGCRECDFCRQGLVNLCSSKVVPGTAKWIGVFVQYFNAPEKTVYKLNDAVSYEMGTMIEPLAVAVRALRRATVKEKDCVVILGAGTIGLLCLVVAKHLGYRKIVCTDTARFNLDMAIKSGATLALDPLETDVVDAVKKLTGGKGADLALVAAGAANILDQASACVRKHGEIGVIAMITEKIPFYSYQIVFNEQTMYGSMTYATNDFREAADMINSGLDLTDFITQTMDIDHTQEGLDILSQKKEDVVKVMIEL
ncbi:MAG: alcohol dehydrogenase catalytic domain-containing protein [Candidatus Accumulibacter sp.]|jgi:L-iditol 2-dehydrogenase|nr:alcohol dehydrogenase catalytic domain-containing protein [Accumulibacter sp.]